MHQDNNLNVIKNDKDEQLVRKQLGKRSKQPQNWHMGSQIGENYLYQI